MSLTKLTNDLNIIQKLDDEPNDVGGLTAAELKAKFDEAGNAIQTYINDTLTTEIDSALSGKISTTTTVNGKPLTGNITLTKSDLGLGNVDNTSDQSKPVSTPQQSALNLKADKSNVLEKDNSQFFNPTADYNPATKKYVDETAAAMALGQVPDGSITEAKLSTQLQGKLNGALQTSGGTVTGNLTVSGALTVQTPTEDAHAVPKAYADHIVPVGAILMWSGTANNIPSRWALCNGENGTPDLTGRFIVGAGDSYQVGDTGGLEEVTLTIDQLPSHSHTYSIYTHVELGSPNFTGENVNGKPISTQSTSAVGGSQSHENRPPYYALCYIMYLGS